MSEIVIVLFLAYLAGLCAGLAIWAYRHANEAEGWFFLGASIIVFIAACASVSGYQLPSMENCAPKVVVWR